MRALPGGVLLFCLGSFFVGVITTKTRLNAKTAEHLLERRRVSALRRFLSEMRPTDVAELLSCVRENDRLSLFRLLPRATAAVVFSELTAEEKRELVSGFSDKELTSLGFIPKNELADASLSEAEGVPPCDTPYLLTSPTRIFLSRIPWLLLLMVSATLTGMIISAFESSLSVCVYLTAFIPMLMDTGGNSGNQASVTVIRSLSLGEIGFGDLLRVIKKEAAVALLCAAALGVASYIKIYLVDFLLLRTLTSGEAVFVPAVVALTLFCTVLSAKLVGAILPITAKRLGLDPAVMASPFITTIVDTLSLAIYFEVAKLLIPAL